MYERRSFLRLLGRALKIWWVTLLIVFVGHTSITDLTWLDTYRDIDWPLLGYQALSLPFIFFIAERLYKFHPGLMGFGLWRLLKRFVGEKQEYHKDGTPKVEGGNINLLGTDIRFVGILVCLLLLTGLPRWAILEEEWFRQGTVGWVDAIGRSFAFGFIHMAFGVPVFAAITISGMGLFYSYMYFQGGVELSAQAHFQYNLILITLLLLATTIHSLAPPSKIE